ncbi:MAG TPA: hypothetical protein VKA46_18175 [Gemmataceae bacterium]|nr:hypothetical protein [Gemmataceae bacterium]
MPAVTFACPECGKVLKSAQPLPAGKKIKCPTCEAVFPMPAQEDEELAAGVSAKRRRPAAVAPADDEDAPPRRKGRRPRDDEDDDEEPRSRRRSREDDDDDDDEDERPRRRSREDDEEDEEPRPRRKKKKAAKRRSGGSVLVLVGVAVVLLLFVVGGGIGAYFIWFAGVNRGSGDEDPLAFAPAGTEVLIGLDVATMMSEPALGSQIEKSMREQARTGDFFESCKKETGLEAKELFARTVIFSDFESLNNNGGMPGGMPAAGMPAAGAPGMPGAGPGMMPPGFQMGRPQAKKITVVLRPSKPFDQKKVAKSFKNPVQKKAHGKVYYEVNEGDFRTAFMPSNRTLILSSLSATDLDSLFTSDGTTPSTSADTAALAHSVDKTLVWMVIPIEGQTRIKLDEAVRKEKLAEKPDPVTPVMEQVAKGKGVAIWSTLEANKLNFGVNVACADPAGATATRESAEKVWNGKKLEVGLGALALAGLGLPKTGKMMSEAIGNVAFSVDGTTAKATSSVSRATLGECIEEVQKKQQQGAVGGGVNLPGRPNPGPPGRGKK